jgi:hypothetical protein
MDIPQYQYVEGLEPKPYKIRPYQCTKCEAIFNRLGAYLIHARGMKYGQCPEEHRLKTLGLRPIQQNGLVIWEALPTQIEIPINQLIENRQPFSLKDFNQPQRSKA